jgi:threonine aldolase
MAAAGFFPRIHLMIWENTHNLSGGRVLPYDLMVATSAVARQHRLSIHLDGARLFNAVAASGVEAHRYAALADTVQFCFSKGLGAPIGSILCGPADLVAEARYLRKRLGGGMRQVGVIAAAARIALRDRDRVKEDHEVARYLAERLSAAVPGLLAPGQVETNMVQLDPAVLPMPAAAWRQQLSSIGIKVNPTLAGNLRLVTHRDVDRGDVDRLVETLGPH